MHEGFLEEWGGVIYWLIYCLSVIIFYTAKEKHSMSDIVYFITELVVLAGGIISIIVATRRTSKSEINKADTNLVKLQGDHNDLKRDHSDISNKLERNENSLAEIKRGTNTIVTEIEAQKREMAVREKLLTPEQVKINDMAKSIEDMHPQWLNQNKAVVQMQEEIDSLKKENANLKEELAAYKKSTRKI